MRLQRGRILANLDIREIVPVVFPENSIKRKPTVLHAVQFQFYVCEPRIGRASAEAFVGRLVPPAIKLDRSAHWS